MSEPVAAASALAPSLVVRLMPWWSRTIAGIAGVALGVFGVLAVFRADSDIGATALLLLGTFFVLVAFLGHVPRIKVGGNELDSAFAYGAGKSEGAAGVVRAIERAAEEAPLTPAEMREQHRGGLSGGMETRGGPTSPHGGATSPARPLPGPTGTVMEERLLKAARDAQREQAVAFVDELLARHGNTPVSELDAYQRALARAGAESRRRQEESRRRQEESRRRQEESRKRQEESRKRQEERHSESE